MPMRKNLGLLNTYIPTSSIFIHQSSIINNKIPWHSPLRLPLRVTSGGGGTWTFYPLHNTHTHIRTHNHIHTHTRFPP